MNDAVTDTTAAPAAEMSKADELRAKRIATAKQKFDRLFNDAIGALEALTAHSRETTGILNQEQAGILSDSISERHNVLVRTLEAHVAAPAVVRKKAKPVAVSLF